MKKLTPLSKQERPTDGWFGQAVSPGNRCQSHHCSRLCSAAGSRESCERYSTVVVQPACKRGKHSSLKLLTRAPSSCVATELGLEASVEAANNQPTAEETSDRLCRCSHLVWFVTIPVYSCGRWFYAGKDSRVEEMGCGLTFFFPKMGALTIEE